jgi:tetratricopeptide (TPR) repeat protein
MKDRFVLPIFVAALALTVARALADDTDVPQGDPDGSIALSEHFSSAAHQIFHEQTLPPRVFDLAANLYRAASRIEPAEPRFLRSLADVQMQMNDVPGAIQTLHDYLNLDREDAREDQTAQLQYIDLYLSSDAVQSLDQRLAYLRYLLQKEGISDPVKSEIALRAGQLYQQKGLDSEAMKMLDSARVLNPMNLKALKTRYILTQTDALPVDRVQQLLGILQANPADPVVASRLAEQLAQLGLVDQALLWYAVADDLYNRTNVRADPAFVLGASSQLLLGKKADKASDLITRYNQALPQDADGWYVTLSCLKYQLAIFPTNTTMQQQYSDAVRHASTAMYNRLQDIRKLSGDLTATTRPVDSSDDAVLPDLSDDPIRLKNPAAHDIVAPYEATLASLAWIDLYYRQDAKSAGPLLDALSRLVPEDHLTLQRLRAWQQYVSGDVPGALAKLHTIASQDPLAQLGVILIGLSDPETKPVAVVHAQKLLDEHPSGVIGAVLWAEFARYGITIDPSPGSGTVATLVNSVPRAFLELVQAPKGFYAVDVSPIKPVFEYGEPVLVRISLQNVSEVDLAIGNDCAIHPTVWLDARLAGMYNQDIPGAAVAQLDKRLVLAPGEIVSTIARIDQDALHPYFLDNPNVDLMVNLAAVINPTQVKRTSQIQPPSAQPGVGGYVQPASEIIAREPTPVGNPNQRQAVYYRLESEDGGEKIRALQVIAADIPFLETQKNNTQFQAIETEFISKLHLTDPGKSTAVRAMQQYLIARVTQGKEQADAIDAMVSSEHWETRMLVLVLALDEGIKGIDIANRLTGDKDPLVKSFAMALSQSMQIAATQPSAPEAAPPPPQAPPPAPEPQTSQTPDMP